MILAGEDVNTTALMEELHSTIQERVVGSIRMDIRASEKDLIEATLPLIDDAERLRERELVQMLADGIGSGGLAASGVDATLSALQLGQVETLVISDDLHAAGWADFELNVFGSGLTPSQHPAGGDPDNIVPDSLEQELIRLALTTKADIEIVQTTSTRHAADLEAVPDAGEELPRSGAARQLDGLGAVGALLRFAMDEATASPDAGS